MQSASNLVDGLQLALQLAISIRDRYRSRARDLQNPDSNEDAAAAFGAERIVESLESALAQAQRQPESCSTRIEMSWEQIQALRLAGGL